MTILSFWRPATSPAALGRALELAWYDGFRTGLGAAAVVVLGIAVAYLMTRPPK